MAVSVGSPPVPISEAQRQQLLRDIGAVSGYTIPAPTGVAATDQAVLEAAMSSSTDVVIFDKPGTYLMNAAINWQSNKWFVSVCGWGEVILKAADATNLNWMFATASGAHDFGATNIVFDVNTAGQSSGSNGGIDATAGTCYLSKWDKCWFKNSKNNPLITIDGDGVVLQDHTFTHCQFGPVVRSCFIFSGVNGVSIDNCLFYDYNTAVGTYPAISLQSGAHNISVDHCTFRPLTSNEFSIEAVSSGDTYCSFSLTNSLLDANATGGTGVSGSFSYSTIQNNRFINGNFLDRSGTETAGDHNLITGNFFENGIVVLSYSSTRTDGLSNGNIIQGNTIRLESATAAQMAGIQIFCQRNCIVSDNAVDIYMSGTASMLSAIHVGTFGTSGPLRNVRISNNNLRINSLSTGSGIRLLTGAGSGNNAGVDYGVDVSILDNTIYGFLYGIRLPSTANDQDVIITRNTVLQCTNPVDGYARGKGVYVAGNKILEGELYGQVQRKSGTYTAINSDKTVLCSTGSGFTVTLPVWPCPDQELVVKKVTSDANTLTIAHNANALNVGLGGALANITTALTTYPSYRFQNTQTALTATMTIAAPGVVTATGHTLVAGQSVLFTTTGALPTGVTAGTIYYVGNISGSTFNLYDTSANGISGGATGRVDTTGSQSGTHTIISNAWWSV